MEWITIILAILELFGPQLEDCFNADAAGVKRLRRFGPRMQTQVYKQAYKQTENWGVDPATRRLLAADAVKCCSEDIKDASDAELLEFIELMYELRDDSKFPTTRANL